MAKLTEESRARVEAVNNGGGINLSLTVQEMRDVANHYDSELKGDFIFSGVSEEKFISAIDKGIEYSVPFTILRPVKRSNSWNNIMVYFHGGGWVRGSRKSHMRVCEIISQ